MTKRLETVPFFAVPVGLMPCVACSDFRKRPGQMWVGYTSVTHEDLFITCPACNGTGQVTRLRHFDARNGKEIDYERPGQRFVHADLIGSVS